MPKSAIFRSLQLAPSRMFSGCVVGGEVGVVLFEHVRDQLFVFILLNVVHILFYQKVIATVMTLLKIVTS